LLGAPPAAGASSPAALSLAPDSPRWELQGRAELTDYLGRRCLYLDGGVAMVKDFELRDGVIDLDVATPAKRGFFGIQFRIQDDGALYRGRSAQSFRDPGFLGIMDSENDAIYLPLKKGPNELLLAVSELGGGWGFICRLADPEKE
jgi:hypothetical protein